MAEEELEIILRAVDEASDTFDTVVESADQMGESLNNSAEEGSAGFDEVSESAEAAADPIEQISTIVEGFVGAEVFTQMADALWDVADKAGNFNDSLMRARLEAEGAGIDVGAMTDAVSELGSTTGRAGGEIRESFIRATARGITDLSSFKTMMNGAGAQATLLGTDIQTMADKFSGFASRSRIMEKALANTGITIDELGQALGMQGATIDDINNKWETMTEDQRAAALGMAATMNEGQTANDEYKKSWAGLQAQLDIARGRLERLAGEVLLPVLVPALETAGRVLNWLGDIVNAAIKGPFGGLISIVGAAAAAFALAVPAYIAVSGAISLLTATAIPAATALWGMVAPLIPFIAIGAAIVLIIYEIGNAFGWWTDVGSMIDAIWAGIQRLWSAFINHPDVQAFLSAMGQAWNILSSAVMSAFNWVMSFFNNANAQGKFDIVRALIDAIGIAWQAITFPIRLVINVVKLLWSTVQTAGNNINNTINNIRNWFAALPGRIRSAISTIAGILLAPFTAGYNSIKGVITNIINKIKDILNIDLGSLTDIITKPISDAYNAVVTEVNKIKDKIKEIPVVGGVIGGALGFGFDIEGMIKEQLAKQQVTPTANNETLQIDHNVNFRFDFSTIPNGLSSAELRNLLMDAFTDKALLQILINNPDFQNIDLKAKSRLDQKRNRMIGGGI